MAEDGASALYRQVAEQLRLSIASGTRTPGEKLPTEPDLMAEFGVGRNTVRQALDLLRSEGLVTTRHGSGSFVADPHSAPMPFRGSLAFSRSARQGEPELAGFQRELKALGRRGSVSLHVERIPAPDEIATRLGMESGEAVVVRRHRQAIGGQPSSLSDSWFPATLVDGTAVAGTAKVRGGTDRAMADMGLEAVRRRDEITARMPTPEEAQELQIAGGVPVVLVIGTEYTVEGLPVEVYSATLPADRYRLIYDVDKTV